MKEIELDDKEIKLIISALDLKISRNLDKAYNSFPYSFDEKEEYKRDVATMELLIDKFLSKLDEVECEEVDKEALVIDWNIEEFKEILKEAIEGVLI
ncbi:hypothetical protein [Clostridioides difficile]|uniref:hypothetical protein n=1 Tax=Clostridioides difficile TaxID=1496 RepID=UPI0010267565|nr:hypothetical protein [Clostridioides difficile]QBJ05047.1 hypothetical protein JD032_2 [Clostridium phage JD032]EIS9703495.1 hypothetical protein [Clostridioides difficile]EIS9889347.1 hypothetical protein [Clostridioides difficile]MBY1096999.1 hypothetical protein [Clostridioides difficile]MBZ0763849.1 hypothetical protein [Clostridioides difficile]